MLEKTGLEFTTCPARIDEQQIKESLTAEGVSPRDQSDALAEAKAKKVSIKHPEAFVLGFDQVLDLNGRCLSKPRTKSDAIAQLKYLSNQTHKLFSAAVIYEEAKPIWRFIGQASLSMRKLDDAWISSYVERNWESIQDSVGGYKIEEEGVILFDRIDGDHFTILGIPMTAVLSYLIQRGILTT